METITINLNWYFHRKNNHSFNFLEFILYYYFKNLLKISIIIFSVKFISQHKNSVPLL